MSRTLGIKLGLVALLILLLMIPMLLIDGLVAERQQLRDEVLQDIANSSSRQQWINGPLLVVPYRRTLMEWKTQKSTGVRYQEAREVRGRLYFLPERFVLDGDVKTELRYRGIYQARLFNSDNRISGRFEVPENFGIREGLDSYRFETAFLAVGINDIRGIRNHLRLRLGSQTLDFQPGSGDKLVGNGVRVPLPALDGQRDEAFDFAFDLLLQGTGQFEVTPVGRDSRIALRSSWPHPSFIGDQLPSEREVREDGFSAHWQSSFFATNLEEILQRCVSSAYCEEFSGPRLGVSFADPVDHYLKSERAIKYALLFIALTFAAFFLFEVLKRLAVHPVQYALVGLALALFYLLLLSLSEHIGFALAYGISAGASVTLIGVYVSGVLRSWRRGGAFALLLAALYGLLYVLYGAEDYALLMGSLLVFCLLACVMLLTRRLDWYGLRDARGAESAA